MGKPTELLAKNLQRISTQLGISQTELAKRSGIAQPTLNVYFNGGREPKLDVLESLANALKCEIQDLLRSEPTESETANLSDPLIKPYAIIYEGLRQAEAAARQSIAERVEMEMRQNILQQKLDALWASKSAENSENNPLNMELDEDELIVIEALRSGDEHVHFAIRAAAGDEFAKQELRHIEEFKAREAEAAAQSVKSKRDQKAR